MNKKIFKLIVTIIFVCVLNCFFFDLSIGRCLDNNGNGKEYNGKPYYNYIAYPDYVTENDIVITGFITNIHRECEYRLFDWVILHDAK